MRTIIFSVMCLLTMSGLAQQTGVKTVTFAVSGNCEECEERIENSADIKGVKLCNWDHNTKIASVTYDESKVSLEQIQKAIAAKGYDTGNYKGDDKAYSKLPKCCQYRTGKCESDKK